MRGTGPGPTPGPGSPTPTAARFGVGLRAQHWSEIEAAPHAVEWYELLADNHLGARGAERARLERLRARVPLALHGVSLSIAGRGPLDPSYLRGLRALADALEPGFVSDHLCWTGLGGHESHDLLPVAYTEEVLAHVAARVEAVQERLGRRLFLENPSAYVAFRGDRIPEAEFLAALCGRTGCGVLLDVNNLFVNAANLGVDPEAYLAAIPSGAVGYLHLAGHAVLADVRIDTHDAAVPEPVWRLYEAAVRRFPSAPVIVERDDAIPPFAALAAEAHEARARHAGALRARGGLAHPVAAGAREAPAAAAGAAPAPPPAVAARWEALQKDFFERLVDKPLGHAHPGVEALLDDSRPVRAGRGMRVYSDGYTAGLRRALATNFAALARVLRADDFEALAAAYLRAHPPRGPGFAGLGARLAEFVRDFGLAAAYDVPRAALAALVALEQAQLEVQAEREEPIALPPATLASIPPERWEGARFAFSPALRLLRAGHDVLPAIEAVARGEEPPRPEAREVAYLVYRGDLGVRTEAIDPGEARVLEGLRAGRPFAEACRAAARAGEGDAELAERGVRALVAACERGLVLGLGAG
jgi:hypothetical protein